MSNVIFEDYELYFEDILNELYVGETPFITNFINLISEARKPYVGGVKRPIKGNKDFIKIGDMLAKEFGFYSVTFTVPFETSMNAFTYPITMAIDASVKNVKPKFYDKVGLKYDPSINKLCTMVAVTAGIWFNKDITDREIAALIMHEIGHSFVIQSESIIDIVEANRMSILVNIIYKIIYDMSIFNLPGVVGDIKTLVNSSNFGKEIINKVTKEVANNPWFIGFKGIGAITEYVSGMITKVFKEALFLFIGPANIITIPIAWLNKLITPRDSMAFSRSQEFLSDSFAMMYGLGPELSSALTKMEYSKSAFGSSIEKIVNSIPFLGALNAATSVPVLLLMNGLNSHPSTIARIDKILNELESELKDADLDPKTKQELKKNIKDLEKVKEDFLKVPENKKYDAEMVKRMMNAYLVDNNPDYATKIEKTYTDIRARDKYVKESFENDIFANIELI